MRSFLTGLLVLATLSACDVDGTDGSAPTSDQSRPQTQAATSGADTMASHDDGTGTFETQQIPDAVERPIMQAQVKLDRLGFTPGVVDGKVGLSTRNAIRGFQQANGLAETGELDEATKAALQQGTAIPATRVVTIPQSFAQGPFYAVPEKPEQQAKMTRLGYSSLDEKLAERFHTTVETLKALNPNGVPAGMKTGAASTPVPERPSSASGAQSSPSAAVNSATTENSTSSGFIPRPGPSSTFRAGQMIRVPNVGADRITPDADLPDDWRQTLALLGVGTDQPSVDKVVVSKSKATLSAYDKSGQLVALFTATMGSTHDPLPLGNWKVTGVGRNPTFAYNPELFWDVPDTDPKLQLPAGPNGPVGVVWIDLSKEHYGIHGTPEPETIGRAQSHGCVRLTNWDAARLAQMVSPGTQVLFEE